MRKRLKDRRESRAIDIASGGLSYTLTYSRGDGGNAAEMFIHFARTGSSAEIAAHDGSIAVSIALQYGAPLEVLRKAMLRDESGTATGVLGAALDTIAEDIEHG